MLFKGKDGLEGTFTPAGMNNFRVTTMEVTDTAIALPGTAFNMRKSMSIIVLSGGTLYIGSDNTVIAGNTLGITSGWPVFINSIFNVDFSGQKDVYGIAETGQTILIKIIEYSG